MKGIITKTGRLRSTRKAIWGSALITIVAVSGFLLFSRATPALAAACAPSTSYGTDTVSFTVTTAGTYTAWVRLLSPDGTNNQVMMNVDGGTCFTMGKSMAANTWTWVNTSAGTSTPVSLSLTAGTHSVVFTGNQPGVGLDEFQFLSDANCVPNGTTNNCTVNQPTPPTVSITAPTAGSTVSGTTTVSATASDTGSITQVVFKVDGTTLATDTVSPYTTTWNTTTATAGTHTITATATDAAGLSTTATETVTVNNPTCTGNPTDPSNLHDTDTAPLPAGKVDLAWTGSTAAAQCTLSGYNIYRNGATTPLNASPVTTATYTDATVAANTTYTYQVEAVDTAQHKSAKTPATPVSVKTGTNCAQGTGAPTTPTALTQSANNYTTISMTWGASTINNGCTLSGYHVYRDGSTTPIATLGLVTSYTDNGPLASGSSHNYTVDAFDSGGNKSASTAVVVMKAKVDDVAPSTPTGLTGTAPNAAAVNLNWTGSTDLPNPGAVGVAGYNIYRNDSTTPTQVINSATATTFSDSTVSASTTYKYSIASFDSNNNLSARTADITVTTPAPTCSGTPSVPTALHSTATTQNSISIAWTASTPSAGCTLQGYQVFRNHALLTTVSSTSFPDTGLAPNTNYIYDIIAVDTSSHKSASTADLTVATAADTTAPSAPTNFVVSAPSPTQVSLGWGAASDNVGVTGYNIYRDGTLLKTVGAVTNATDTTVTQNTTYTYLLEAVDAAGNKSTPRTASTPATIKTPVAADTTAPTVPGKPVAGAVGTTSVALTWAASTDNVAVASYNILRNGTQVNTSTGTSFTDNGLTPNTAYSYTIVAVDTSGNKSAASSALSVTTQPVAQLPVPGDFDGNRTVDIRDFNILIVHWGQTVTNNTNGDMDTNGTVDIRDLNQFIVAWGSYINTNGSGTA